MDNSKRVAWYEAAYHKIRSSLLEEAPANVTIAVGFPSKKKQGQDLCVADCVFEALDGAGGFGAENVITLHPLVLEDHVLGLAALSREMIHHSLESSVKNGKQFQVIAKRIGLCKPWTSVQPDGDLQQALRGIALEVTDELGYQPDGSYTPPPAKEVSEKPATTIRLRCHCNVPRVITLKQKQIAEGSLICGRCKKDFHPMPPSTQPGA